MLLLFQRAKVKAGATLLLYQERHVIASGVP